jgi:hypothetical protein
VAASVFDPLQLIIGHVSNEWTSFGCMCDMASVHLALKFCLFGSRTKAESLGRNFFLKRILQEDTVGAECPPTLKVFINFTSQASSGPFSVLFKFIIVRQLSSIYI